MIAAESVQRTVNHETDELFPERDPVRASPRAAIQEQT